MDNHPLCGHFFSGCPQYILHRFSDVFKICSDVLRSSQMFSDDHRCFWIFSKYSIYVLLMFSRCSLDVLRIFAGFFQDVFTMLWWVLWAWWILTIISNESMDFNGPKEFDDPQLFDDPSYSMIPAIQWSPAIRWSQAIRWSPAIRWSIGSMDFYNPKVYRDT